LEKAGQEKAEEKAGRKKQDENDPKAIPGHRRS
jgi:hypothetical protein